jgi:peptide/nickel transport system permease protein
MRLNIQNDHLSLNLKPMSQGQLFLYRLSKNRFASLGLGFIILIILMSVFAPIIIKTDPNSQGDLVHSRYLSPSLEHPFGTDKFARDVFSRVWHGARISLTVSFSVVILSLTIGLFYGTISGYSGGWIDSLMMRILDFILAFPVIFLLIIVVAVFSPNLFHFILLLSITGWMESARMIRAEVLSVRERDYVQAAVSLGLSRFKILFYHVIPNSLSPLLIMAPLKIGRVILLESALSFLGIGIQPPTASWGNIIHDGSNVLINAWWIATFPGILIVLTVMSFNFIGEGIKESMRSKF